MRGGRQDDAQHEENRRPHDTGPPPKTVDDSTKCQHAEDLTDQERVGEASLDNVRHCTVVSDSDQCLYYVFATIEMQYRSENSGSM